MKPLNPIVMRSLYAVLLRLFFCSLIFGCTSGEKRYVIGVSQCSDDEWRTQMNQEIQREAFLHTGVSVDIRTAQDNTVQQIHDIEELVSKKVDLLVVSPNEAEALAPVIEKAYAKGIPVVLVDRKINSDKYTAFVGTDNFELGRIAGEYVVSRLHGNGKVIEITGLGSSTPAAERSGGFMAALSEAPDITVLASVAANWQRQDAREVTDSLLAIYPDVDLIFAQNDPMALGAYDAACRQMRQQDILFVGVDALTGEGLGVEKVLNGVLDATFIYYTGGDVVMQTALAILNRQPYKCETLQSTALVNKANARILMMQTERITGLNKKLERLNKQLDVYFLRYSYQRTFLYTSIIVLIVVCALLYFVVRAFWQKNRLNKELSTQKSILEEQRDQLVSLSRKLEEATYAKLAFFTNISHDFRTPLTLISDPVNQLMKSNNLDPNEHTMLNIVQKNVTILLRLINQILDFRKFESGKLAMQLSEFNIAGAMMEWTEAFRGLAYQKHIRFNIHKAPSEDDYMMIGDAEKMERIMYNLLSNAFKFTPEGGAVCIELSQFENEGKPWLRIEVKDTGVGMSAEHVSHIFERFYQVDVHYTGSGIGLALVKAFVELHQGKIFVEGNNGKGTVFRLELPMRQSGIPRDSWEKSEMMQNLKEGALLDAASEAGLRPGTTCTLTERETVLIIDDNQDVRNYVKMLLADSCTIVEASDGQEGIRMAMKYVPDAIICDVMMPVMDGIECCRRLKSELQTSHIPVMMLTAYTMDEQKIKGYECGADSYVSKPFSADLLRARLRNLIDNRKRLKNAIGDNPSAEKEPLNRVDKSFVERLYQLIHNNIGRQELSVEWLGEQLGLSRVQLYRKTKSLTSYTPNELVRVLRLKRAANLLASTDKTIAEITYEVGFNSPSYFTKCYKDFFGELPTEFLKRKGS